MSYLLADRILEELLRFCPCPTDEFAACEWHQEMMKALEKLLLKFSAEHQRLLEVIASEGLISDTFFVAVEVEPKRRVDVSKLRECLPKVFDSVVHIRCFEAERFIGRRRLYELSLEAAGSARVREVEVVTVRDLEKVLPAAEVAQFVQFVEKPGKSEVRRFQG